MNRCSLFCLSVVLAFLATGCVATRTPPSPPPEVPAGEETEVPAAADLPRRTDAFGQTFVQIPAGTFLMGSPRGEQGRDGDERPHLVRISKPFWLMTTEVTQETWERVMGRNPAHFNICGPDCPVEEVSWKDVQHFIERLNQEGDGSLVYRLPTEAEWEYACRAGGPSAFAGGDPGSDLFAEPAVEGYGWYVGNSDGSTHGVGLKRPNRWGLYDMHGNVWEWVADAKKTYPDRPQTDPQPPVAGQIRVRRGGAWNTYGRLARCAFRSSAVPDYRDPFTGLRLAADLAPPPEEEPLPEAAVPSPPPPPPPPALPVILFPFDRADLTADARKALDRVVEILASHPGRIALEGHTCALGSDAYNEDLSRRRMESVRAYLVAHSVDPDRLVTGFFGEKRPRLPNDTREHRRLNRRVELHWLPPEGGPPSGPDE